MTVAEALAGINAYPVPQPTFEAIAVRRGVTLSDDATQEVLTGKEYQLCRADVLMFLAAAPDVSQGGQSYSFTDEQRKAMRSEAGQIYSEQGEQGTGVVYGYKGSRL